MHFSFVTKLSKQHPGKLNNGKSQLIYHISIFPPQQAPPLGSNTVSQLWFSAMVVARLLQSAVPLNMFTK